LRQISTRTFFNRPAVLIIVLCLFLTFAERLSTWYSIVIIVVLGSLIVLLGCLIWLQPQIKEIQTFKVPFVPFFPFLSVLVNTYMMMTLTAVTWARFMIWFAIGLFVYSVYGIKNSVENEKAHHQVSWFPCLLKRDTVGNGETSVEKEEVHLPTISEDIVFNRSTLYKF
jgi:hypothetical protein